MADGKDVAAMAAEMGLTVDQGSHMWFNFYAAAVAGLSSRPLDSDVVAEIAERTADACMVRVYAKHKAAKAAGYK